MKTLSVRPSGLWLIVGPIFICLWMAAVNYTNNLVYAILYLLGALSFLSIFHGRRYLIPLEIRQVRLISAPAGEEVRMEIFLHNPDRNAISGFYFRAQDREEKETVLSLSAGQLGHVAGESSTRLVVMLPAQKRGRYHVHQLVVNSLYPFGLFRVSRTVAVDADYYVYPAREGALPWPENRLGAATGQEMHTVPGDDFGGLRPYVPGDSIRHIDWKSYARGRAVAVKYFTGGEASELWLEDRSLHGLGREAQLSQLAKWVEEAEQAQLAYGLRWGGRSFPAGLGPVHAQRILEFLAVVPEDI